MLNSVDDEANEELLRVLLEEMGQYYEKRTKKQEMESFQTRIIPLDFVSPSVSELTTGTSIKVLHSSIKELVLETATIIDDRFIHSDSLEDGSIQNASVLSIQNSSVLSNQNNSVFSISNEYSKPIIFVSGI